MLLSDAAEVRCAGPGDCGWEAGPKAAAGDEPSGAAWPCPIDLLEEADGAAAGSRNRLLVAENMTFFVGGSENT